jgi:hypothetical protein
MRNYHKWKDSELDYIKNNHVLLSDEELAANLSKIVGDNITTSMIRRQRRNLVLKKERGRRPKVVNVMQEDVDSDKVEVVINNET